jgi:hypothetical protein
VLGAIAIAIFFSVLKQHAAALFESGIIVQLASRSPSWAVFAIHIVVNAAVFIALHPFVVLGQLLDWLTTSLLAALITAWCQHAGGTSFVSSLL